jgi:hypothetical protein
LNDDIVHGWFKFLADCRRDSGYANSHQAGLDMGALRDRWAQECPGLETPSVIRSNDEGRYALTNLSEPKRG